MAFDFRDIIELKVTIKTHLTYDEDTDCDYDMALNILLDEIKDSIERIDFLHQDQHIVNLSKTTVTVTEED